MNEQKSEEVRLAVIESDIKYIKEKIDSLNYKDSFEKQGERIGALEQSQAILINKVKVIAWFLTAIGTTSVAAVVGAIFNLILK